MKTTHLVSRRSFELCRFKKVAAFTLIELLVVIAIIMILAALLGPALGQAKLKASNSRDISRMKQLVVALYMYTDDNEGALPIATPGGITLAALAPTGPIVTAASVPTANAAPTSNPDMDYGGWIKQLARYVGVNKSNCPDVSEQYHDISAKSVFACAVPATGDASLPSRLWSFSMNHDLRQPLYIPAGTKAMKLSEFPEQDKVFAFAETGCFPDAENNWTFLYAFYGHYSISAGPPHAGKGIPIAYLDGHLEFIPPVTQNVFFNTKYPWNHKSFWGRQPCNFGCYSAPFDP